VTLLNVGALYLLTLAGGIALLYFLRARSRRVEVSALFLWEGLRSAPRSRAARIRRRIEPLLLVQLLVLALLALALAQPAFRGMRPHLSRMAIVLDGSASMQTRTESGKTRYELAREQGIALLHRYPSTTVTVLQLSKAPEIIAPLTDDHDVALRAVSASSPTWTADGSPEALRGLLESQGGSAAFERVTLFTDRPFELPLPGLEQVIFGGGKSLAITAYTVRENEDAPGTTAFVKIRNDTNAYQERRLRVGDGDQTAVLSILLAPGQEQGYALPFPGSSGASFIATIEPGDAFAADDTRTFALQRSIERRVRWIGESNRYLEAALAAVTPIIIVSAEDQGPVDLTVAYNAQLSSDIDGNILLVHAGVDGLVAIGDERRGENLIVAHPSDPLLAGVDPLDFRVRSAPQVRVSSAGTTVLTLGEEPFLYRLAEQGRTLVLISPDLMETNLPLTVDFPLLIRNILNAFTPLPAQASYAWSIVGEPIRVDGYGAVIGLEDPAGRSIRLSSNADSFIPQIPGLYALKTDRGTYSLAVNVDPAESLPPGDVLVDAAPEAVTTQAQVLYSMWPIIAGLGLLALLLEAGMYHGWRLRPVK